MSKCEEMCRNDATCEMCAASEPTTSNIIEIRKLEVVVNNVKKTFKPSTMRDCDDVCDSCIEHGIGQYTFDQTTGICSFCDTCTSDLLGFDDEMYLRELK